MRVAVLNVNSPSEAVYIQKDLYLGDVRGRKPAQGSPGKKRTTKIVRKLGKMSDLMTELHMSRDEVIAWAKEEARRMTEEEKKENEKIVVTYDPTLRIDRDAERLFGSGYLFLQSLYYSLRLDNTCRTIRRRHKFQYDLNAILSDLIYARVLEPCCKRASYQYCQTLLEPPKYEPHDVYRALSVLAEEMDYILADVYRSSNLVVQRNRHILYYDCTNFFFEIEEADGLRQYGRSKENRPNPIVHMGLLMDADGIPMSMTIFSGAANEQPSLKPLEQKVIRDCDFDSFVICTDSGLGSEENRRFNDMEGRAFIVTQSLKKLKEKERESAMSCENWHRLSDGRPANNMKEIMAEPEAHTDEIYYKEEPYGTKKVAGQLMIITYSPKYAVYQKTIRGRQIERAEKMIENGQRKKEGRNPNDPARFVRKTAVTENGETADQTYLSLDEERIREEERYDGFYAVCTDLVNDSVKDILAVSEGRWEIEESFRIMKSDFRSRPVHLSRDDRIKAHFLICYLALLEYRILEKKLGEKYTTAEILNALRGMKVMAVEGVGYLPAYKRTAITDALHSSFGFYTDWQIMTKSKMRSVLHQTKQKKP
jgi:transposase